MSPNPRRILSTIHDCPDSHCVVFDSVENRKRKSFGKRSVEAAIRLSVDASEYFQALNISIEIDQEITAKPFFFVLVIVEPFDEVPLGEVQQLEPHCVASLICCLASSQSTNLALPSPIRRSRS